MHLCSTADSQYHRHTAAIIQSNRSLPRLQPWPPAVRLRISFLTRLAECFLQIRHLSHRCVIVGCADADIYECDTTYFIDTLEELSYCSALASSTLLLPQQPFLVSVLIILLSAVDHHRLVPTHLLLLVLVAKFALPEAQLWWELVARPHFMNNTRIRLFPGPNFAPLVVDIRDSVFVSYRH